MQVPEDQFDVMRPGPRPRPFLEFQLINHGSLARSYATTILRLAYCVLLLSGPFSCQVLKTFPIASAMNCLTGTLAPVIAGQCRRDG